METPDKLILSVIEADIDTSTALLKMSAYCKIKYGAEEYKTETKETDSFKPLWNDRHEINVLDKDDELTFEVHNSFMGSTLVGSTTLKVGDIAKN